MIYSSFALVPALAAIAIASRYGAHPPSLLLTLAGSLLALSASTSNDDKGQRRGSGGGSGNGSGNRPDKTPAQPTAPLRRRPRDLPTADAQREILANALQAELRADPGPQTREQTAAWMLRRSLSAWGQFDLNALGDDQLCALYLMSRLLLSPPGEAGELAQYFHRPDAVLGLRDEVDEMTRIRAEWDRSQRLFLATQWQWVRQRNGQAPASLCAALQALGPSDIDLWHRVVLQHDPSDPQQRSAALWCLRQTGCDRATVAAYLAQIALDGTLLAAARRGNTAYLNDIRSMIDSWNAGRYRTADLALNPSNAIKDVAPRFQQVLEQLEAMTGTAWPMPKGAFTRYEGRAPRLRHNWDLASGRLSGGPQRADYFAPQTPLTDQPDIL